MPPSLGYAAAHRVLVVERPPVEKINVVAAIHAHAGPEREIVLRSLGIELPHGELVVGDAGEMKERRQKRERGDDARANPGLDVSSRRNSSSA